MSDLFKGMALGVLLMCCIYSCSRADRDKDFPAADDKDAPDSLTIILPEPATLGNRKVKHIVVEFLPKEQQ